MMVIHNATILQIPTHSEALAVYERGAKSRKVQSTEMNEFSSRSHLIFTIMIHTVNQETG
jgi:kinesin family protein 11